MLCMTMPNFMANLQPAICSYINITWLTICWLCRSMMWLQMCAKWVRIWEGGGQGRGYFFFGKLKVQVRFTQISIGEHWQHLLDRCSIFWQRMGISLNSFCHGRIIVFSSARSRRWYHRSYDTRPMDTIDQVMYYMRDNAVWVGLIVC